ncbi:MULTISPECIES: hypothetical protein [unclassified Nonomuraea]|uniref:hypothetical protein n=1 Tax=unclassified Nonomuraea TaxID=2593643 RepID=UPI0034115376
MADDLKPARTTSARRGAALAVAVAAALLVLTAIMPWAGIEARSDLLGGGVSDDVRGIDVSTGLYTLLAGLAALALGVTGLLGGRPRVAALAVIPGALATLLLVMFVADPGRIGDRLSIDLGRLLSVEPVIRFGWFAALACSLAIVVLSVLTLVRRAR